MNCPKCIEQDNAHNHRAEMMKSKLEDAIKRLLDLDERELDARSAQADQDESERRKHAATKRLLDDVPADLKDATLKGYRTTTAEQANVLKQCAEIGHGIAEFIERGRNVIWMGHVGVGKDMMAVALLKRATQLGFSCRWKDGREMYDDMIQEVRDQRPAKSLDALCSPDVLCLSDPVFDAGWSDAKANYLNRIVRRRLSAGRSTWVTCNVARDKAGEMFGPDVWSRLCFHATILECRWNDYRKQTS